MNQPNPAVVRSLESFWLQSNVVGKAGNASTLQFMLIVSPKCAAYLNVCLVAQNGESGKTIVVVKMFKFSSEDKSHLTRISKISRICTLVTTSLNLLIINLMIGEGGKSRKINVVCVLTQNIQSYNISISNTNFIFNSTLIRTRVSAEVLDINNSTDCR